MKKSHRRGACAATKYARWTALLCLLPMVFACQTVPTAAAAKSPAESWRCRNDLEITCNGGQCTVEDSHTAMDVTVHHAGGMRVCAYSGCWAGTGAVFRSENFIVISGDDLPFSTAPDSADSRQDIIIAIDRNDDVGVLKAGAFAQPIICRKIVEQPSFDYGTDR